MTDVFPFSPMQNTCIGGMSTTFLLRLFLHSKVGTSSAISIDRSDQYYMKQRVCWNNTPCQTSRCCDTLTQTHA